METNNVYKVDHRYNSKNNLPAMVTTSDRPSVKSYREQIETILSRWHRLQKEKRQQCQPINFEHIMETDLERQLHELEQQEREQQQQYNLLEQALELEFNQNNHHASTTIDIDKKQIEILKDYEHNQQQREYDSILKELKQYEQKHIPKYRKKEYIYIRQQKQILQSQLTIIKENQMKIRKIVHLFESYVNKKKIYVIQKSY